MNQKIISKLLENSEYSSAIKAALKTFCENRTETNCNAILKPFNANTNSVKSEPLTAITDYIQFILEDNVLDSDEMKTLLAMKRFFRINEGDFLRYKRHDTIKQILSKQLKIIYLDNKVDKFEASMKVDLQSLFGLSYDELLSFEQEAVEEALKNGANISDLDTFYKL